jgi:hypothetical protein
MGKKFDVRRIEAIAKEFGMEEEERRDFGDYIEECKGKGDRGSGKNGDFTYAELREKVSEFQGEKG